MGLFKFKKKKDIETEQKSLDKLFNEGVASVTDYVKKQDEAREKENRDAIEKMDYIFGGIKQSKNAPGFSRSYDVATSEAKKIAEELNVKGHSDIVKEKKEENPDVTIAKELIEKWRNSDQINLTEEKLKVFYNKFPQYLEIKQILKDSEKGIIDSKTATILKLLEKNASKKFPNFVLDDLLVPFLVEKKAMKLSTIDEDLFLAGKYSNASKLGLSKSEYSKIIVEYVKIIVALMYKLGKEINNFASDFTACLNNAFEDNRLDDSSKVDKIKHL